MEISQKQIRQQFARQKRAFDEDINSLSLACSTGLEVANRAHRNSQENDVAIRAVMRRLDRRMKAMELRLAQLEKRI